MTCEQCRQNLLELGWTRDQRKGAMEALQHLNACAECQAAMDEYERLRDQLKSPAVVPAPRGGWEQFEGRLLRSVQPRRIAWLPQALGMAAAFLLGMLAIEAIRWMPAREIAIVPPTPPATNPISPAATPPFTPLEVTQHAQAFDQVSQVFDRKTSWVLLANNSSDVGLVEQPMAQAHKLLLLRLTMLHSGESISTSDLVIVPGQSASLTVPLQNGQSVHYEIGTSQGEPTRLSLWAELQGPTGGQAIGALATTLQLQPDQKVSAGELATNSGAYQLKVGFSQAPYSGGKL